MSTTPPYLGILAAAVPAVASAAGFGEPFAPIPAVPDHVITMAPEPGSNSRNSYTMKRHGHWTRIDAAEDRTQPSYLFRGGALRIDISRFESGGSRIAVTADHALIGWDTEPHVTGERDTVLGERCTVWDVRRTKDDRSGAPRLHHLSCVTDDGIELWHKTIGSSSMSWSYRAMHLERRPVAPDEVTPPPDLLSLGWWDRDEPAPQSAPPDFEAVLQMTTRNGDEGDAVRTVRRHHPWLLEAETEGATLRRLTISHATFSKSLAFRARHAEKNFSIDDRPGPRPVPHPAQFVTDGSSSMETVLGESCRWLRSAAMDGGEDVCRTEDGIPLKQRRWSRGRSDMWTAVQLARRPLALDEVKPPAELLSLDWWMEQIGAATRR